MTALPFKPIVPPATLEEWYNMPVSALQLRPELLAFLRDLPDRDRPYPSDWVPYVDVSGTVRTLIDSINKAASLDASLTHETYINILRGALEAVNWPPELTVMVGQYGTAAITDVNEKCGLLAAVKIPREKFADPTLNVLKENSLLYLALMPEKGLRPFLGLSKQSIGILRDEVLRPFDLDIGVKPSVVKDLSVNPTSKFFAAYRQAQGKMMVELLDGKVRFTALNQWEIIIDKEVTPGLLLNFDTKAEATNLSLALNKLLKQADPKTHITVKRLAQPYAGLQRDNASSGYDVYIPDAALLLLTDIDNLSAFKKTLKEKVTANHRT